jgi:hypothetical protein
MKSGFLIAVTLCCVVILSGCTTGMSRAEVKAICPVQITDMSWSRFYFDSFDATLTNTSDKAIDRLYGYLTYDVLQDLAVSNDSWITGLTVKLKYDLGIAAGEPMAISWELNETGTIRIDEANTYISEIYFSDGTDWLASDY